MKTNQFQHLSSEMYLAIKNGYPGEPQIERCRGTMRAIKFCVDYLLSLIQFMGSSQQENIIGITDSSYTPAERSKFDSIAKKLSIKMNKLRDEVVLIIQTAWIEANYDRKISREEYEQYLEGKRNEIQAKINEYLKDIGFSEGTINSFANYIFPFLSSVADAVHKDNKRKFVLRHNIKGAIMWLKHFF